MAHVELYAVGFSKIKFQLNNSHKQTPEEKLGRLCQRACIYALRAIEAV